MNKVAKFYKVSFEQFLNDSMKLNSYINYNDSNDIKKLQKIYDNITLPTRKTIKSAGYDFVCPFNIVLNPNEKITIPTGIKVFIEDGWVLKLYPRSSIGIKKNIVLQNSVGILDGDYFDNVDNEGDILACIKNTGDTTISIHEGENFVQGVFVPFGFTKDDEVTEIRVGGIGSTGEQ